MHTNNKAHPGMIVKLTRGDVGAARSKIAQLSTSQRAGSQRISNKRSYLAQAQGSGSSETQRKLISQETATGLKSGPVFLFQLFGASLAASVVVKYGSQLIDLPSQPNAPAALALITLPTLLLTVIIALKK